MCPHGDPKFFYKETKKAYSSMYITKNYLEKSLMRFPGIIHVQVAGMGEPFIHPHIFQIIEIINKKRKLISIVTNGTLLDKRKIDKLLNFKYLDFIQISLNAHNKKTYKLVTGGDDMTFNKVVKNLKYLSENKKGGVNIILSNVLTKEVLTDVKLFLELAISLGADSVYLQDFIKDHHSVGVYRKYKSPLKAPSINEIIKTINEIKEKYDNKIKIIYPKIRLKKRFTRKCESFFKTIQINADGYIGSCGIDMLPEKSFGHIDDKEIWNSDYMRCNRLRFLDKKLPLHECCLDCPSNY
jgi:radical SAM protein with 4Fe4S-binding SPASM domain